MKISDITQRMERIFPSKRRYPLYIKSWAVTTFCIYLCVQLMNLFLWWHDWVSDSVLFNVLSWIGYAVLLPQISKLYGYLAEMLTEMENHQTESQYEIHLALKRVTFELTNNFCILFYIAFIQNDLDLLRYALSVLFVSQSIFSNFEEVIIPHLLRGSKLKEHQMESFSQVKI